MPSTSIRIDEEAMAVLRELGRNQRQPLQTVLKEAINNDRRQKFLEDANAAFAALRSDPEAWRAEQQERELWDRVAVDDQEQE